MGKQYSQVAQVVTGGPCHNSVAQGIKQRVGIESGKRAADCERILRGLGIASEIDVYLGGDSVSRPKPAPDLAEHAMARLGCAPAECVVIGDANADIAMGKASGARTIQVLWGFARERIDGSDDVVATWAELRETVFALAGRAQPILRDGGALGS